MVYIEIEPHSQVPIYAQIMDRIRALVREGTLLPDAPLPSVRQLAADLEVNPNTVARAYSLLERDGLVETARRRGTLIAAGAADVARKTVGERLGEAIDRVLEVAASIGVDRDELVQALEQRARAADDPRSERGAT